MNDRGIPAACDGDMDCLLTMLIFQYALNRAVFPVAIDVDWMYFEVP